MPATTPTSTAARGRLIAVLGVAFGVAITVGNMIGAGILRTPGSIATQLPTFWPFLSVWIVGGIYALLGANSLAELGALVPRSGGQYVFVRRGLGEYAGFVVGWSDWISTCGTTAAVALVIGESVVALFPEARSMRVVALAVIALLTVVQWFGVRGGAMAQQVTSAIKGVALLLFVAACFWFGTRNPAAASMTLDSEGSLLLAYVIALQAVIYTYDGWTAVIYFSEEVRNPGRDIPRSMIGGVLAVIAFYLLINLAMMAVVPLPTLAGHDLAAGAVAERLFGLAGMTFIRVLTIVALISAVNSNVLMAPRVLFAMSRDRLFWRGASEVNAGGTPDIALLISSVLAAVIVINDRFETVVAKLAFFFVANYTLSFITLFVLRHREPDAPRPYRAWGHPFTTGLALLASITFLLAVMFGDRRTSIECLVVLVLSFPLWLLLRRRMTPES